MEESKTEPNVRILYRDVEISNDSRSATSSSDGSTAWAQKEVGQEDLKQQGEFGNCFYFLSSEALKNADLRHTFSERLHIPEWYWHPFYQRINGGFGCEDDLDDEGNTQSRRTWTRFLVKILNTERDCRNYPTYTWYEMGFFSLNEKGHTKVLCLNTPPDFVDLLFVALTTGTTSTLDDFWSFEFILHQITQLYDESVWSIRNVIREIEKERDQVEHEEIPNANSHLDPLFIHKRRRHAEPDFLMLHELARHAIHSSETIELAIGNIKQIIREHSFSYELSSMERKDPLRRAAHNLRQKLDFRLQYLESVKARSDSISARVHNEINLVSQSFPSRCQTNVLPVTLDPD